MGELIAALFEIAWGTVSLVEILWTLGALVAMLIALGAIWRTRARSAYLRQQTNAYARRRVNADMLTRRTLLAVVLELAFFLGLWSMLEPQAPGLTSSAAIAGLAFWLVELAIIAVVMQEEVTYWMVRRHLEGE